MTFDHTHALALYDEEMRRGAPPEGPDGLIERSGAVVRHTGPVPGWNGVIWSDLDETTADAVIAEQVAHYAAREGGAGVEWEWKLYDYDRPADLADRLLAAGFEADEPETLMLAPVGALPLDAEPPAGVRLEAVTDEAGVELMMEALREAFGRDNPQVRHLMLTQLREQPEVLAAVVAMAGDRPVSAARLELLPGASFGGLWGGGTVAEWRGKGIYRALVAHRARIAAERGVPYLQVDASSMSRPILERLGFTPAARIMAYTWHPAAGAGSR
ncbi:GNAT family N-acetyltransferase [Streptomyces sp. NPDC101118]|uniref:GNAT family N-acetyltransferase n=1 Tax=Streptomyces sp. NPDC101118 TaxID=3366109 RepID=UPI00380C060F